MLFRHIIFLSLLTGILAGTLFTLAQQIQVTPIILAAETYEVADSPAINDHHADAGAHHHDAEAWAPEDGIERFSYSLLANVLTAIGFAAMLLTLMAHHRLKEKAELTHQKGLIWGFFGYLTLFVAPSLGLLPEIPGTMAAALESRQLWWLGTVIATGVGFYLIFFFNIKFKVAGISILLLPHLLGAPHISGPEFANPDPAAIASLQELHHRFIVSSGLVNLMLWLSIGLIGVWSLNRWLFTDKKGGTAAKDKGVK